MTFWVLFARIFVYTFVGLFFLSEILLIKLKYMGPAGYMMSPEHKAQIKETSPNIGIKQLNVKTAINAYKNYI